VRTLAGFDDLIDWKAVAFSPNGELLAAKGGHQLRAWRVRDWVEMGAPIHVNTNWNGNNAVAFSQDGLTLATRLPGGVGFVDVRHWRTNGILLPGSGALGTVLTYSPNGRFLAMSEEGKLHIVNIHPPLGITVTLTPKDG
jgi:hypothetical protein